VKKQEQNRLEADVRDAEDRWGIRPLQSNAPTEARGGICANKSRQEHIKRGIPYTTTEKETKKGHTGIGTRRLFRGDSSVELDSASGDGMGKINKQ